MNTWIIVAVVAAAVVLLALVFYAVARTRRRRTLQGRFGSEYERTVADAPNRRTAERDLSGRLERRNELDISALDPTAAQRYRDQWRLVQERFVDAPAESVAEAHTLLRMAMSERGYPTDDRDERVAMLSVDHADVLDRYREGAAVEDQWRSSGTTDTEQLRQAMQHYRAVFSEIVGDTDTDVYPSEGGGSAVRTKRGTPASPAG